MLDGKNYPKNYPLRDTVDRTLYPAYSLTKSPDLMFARLRHDKDLYYRSQLFFEHWNSLIDLQLSYIDCHAQIPAWLSTAVNSAFAQFNYLSRLATPSWRYGTHGWNNRADLNHTSTLDREIAAAVKE